MPLPADRLPADLRTLNERIAKLERSLTELRAAKRLEHSSIDGGALVVRDSTGAVRATIGNQNDGTVAVVSIAGPVPPTPTDPVVTAELAALGVTWDGQFVGGVAAPADWLRVEVHVGAAADFTPDQTTLRQTIETAAGATVLIPLGYTEWFIKLRSMTTSGVPSAPTAAVASTPRQADADDITADAITGKTISGGTITGTLVQTGTSGARITLNEDGSHRINLYDVDGDLSARIDPDVTDGLTEGGAFISYGLDGGGNPVTTQLSNGRITVIDPDNPATVRAGGMYSANPFAGTGYTLSLTPMSLSGNDAPQISVSAETGANSSDDDITLQTHNLSINSIRDFNEARVGILGSLSVGRDQYIGGNLIKAAWNSNAVWGWTPLTWQTPSYATGWSGSTTLGTSTNWGSLKFRLDAEDSVWLIGGFKAASGAGLTVFQLPNLPINYRPNAQWPVPVLQRTSGGTTTFAFAQITGSGNLNIVTQAGLAVAAGTEYLINAKVPLGNIA